ncbi:protein nrt1/ ptr family 6.2 [Quercus suber]|uniref:Protein nrt1/ ptr family 6.2 n=1 Tax=Quercus suber TaxID=58331 RepID=A0AAW0KVK3_QUESU
MGTAALVEKRRLSVVEARGGTMRSTTLPISASFYFHIGIREAFMLSGELDFFTNNAPNGMKAITTALYLTSTSFGMFFSTILVTIISNYSGCNDGHNWLPPSINKCRLDNFYCFLALLTLIDLGFYIVCALRYRPNSTEIVPEMNGVINTPPREENV